MPHAEIELIELARNGDERAFGRLVEKYQRLVHGYAYQLIHDPLAAEDIAQEVFLQAFIDFSNIRNPEKIGSWLCAITRHRSIDWIRANKLSEPLTDDLTDQQTLPLDELEKRDTHRALIQSIRDLSEPNRIVVTLRYMEELSNQQIAELLDISPSVVSTRLNRALRLLEEKVLLALAEGFPKPDIARITQARIRSLHPLIGMHLFFPDQGAPSISCLAMRTARLLAEQTGGVFQEQRGKGFTLWYGTEHVREDDVKHAMQMALKLQKQCCTDEDCVFLLEQRVSSKPLPTHSNPVRCCEAWENGPNILVDSIVAWSLRHDYQFEAVTGTSDPVAIYRYMVPSQPNLLHNILVGRQRELAQLEEAVHQVMLGGFAIVRITGEAGIGKTHLLRELRRRCADLPLTWLEGRVERNQPYQEIREALLSHVAFHSGEELHDYLGLFADLQEGYLYLAELLGLSVKDDRTNRRQLEVEQLHYRSFPYLRDLLSQMAEISPLVLVIDDTHWLSAESSRLLQYLCRLANEVPILFIFARRSGYETLPEAEPMIALERQCIEQHAHLYQTVSLSPLPAAQGHELLSHFLGDRQLLPSTLKQVLRSTAGNPLHLREAAQFLVGGTGTFHMPPTLTRLVLAHLDLLPAHHQDLLRYVSVVGERVNVTLLQVAFPDISANELHQLVRSVGWIESRQGEYEQEILVWKHILYRESVYESIVPEMRRRIHAEVAAILDEDDRTPPDVLADHYEAAGNAEKATHYACLVTVESLPRGYYAHVQRYAEMALSHPEYLSAEQQVDVRSRYGVALKQTGQSYRAREVFEKALELAYTNEQRIHIYARLSTSVPEPKRQVEYRRKAFDLIDESTDTHAISVACDPLNLTSHISFHMDAIQRVLYSVQQRNEPEAEIVVLRLLAYQQAHEQQLEDALSTLRQVTDMVDTIAAGTMGHAEYLMIIDLDVSAVYELCKRPEQAIEHLHRALERWDQQNGWTFGMWSRIGSLYWRLGQYRPMIDAIEKALEYRDVVVDSSAQVISHRLAQLVQGYAYEGNWDKAHHAFWQMMELVGKDAFSLDYFRMAEEAVGAMCYGDKHHCRWLYEGVPETMARAQHLIQELYEHGIQPEGNENPTLDLLCLHPILAAAYVEYGATQSRAEAIALLRRFARQVWILAEHVEFWAYLVRTIDRNLLEMMLRDALEQVSHEAPISLTRPGKRVAFLFADYPEKLILEWLLACLHEHYEIDEPGSHLRQMGIIPEFCWYVAGPFDMPAPNEVEQHILDEVFSTGISTTTWYPPNDVRDGFVDLYRWFQCREFTSAYARTVIHSPVEQMIWFTCYHDDGVCVWVNGDLCFKATDCGYKHFEVLLQPGHNTVLVYSVNLKEAWGFLFRVTDHGGQSVPTLTFVHH